MRVNASPIRVTLRWGTPLTVRDGQGACITARSGTVWITQDNDRRDIVLTSGESFRLERPDTAIVQAMDTAEVLVLPPSLPVATAGAWHRTALDVAARLLGRLRGPSDHPVGVPQDLRTPALAYTAAGR